MKILNITVVSLLVTGLNMSSAFAGDLRAALASAGRPQTFQQQTTPSENAPIPNSYKWLGGGLFVGGMAVAINGFLNNRNGDFPEFGEATSTNVKMGAGGLAAAFAGGAILFIGKRQANRSASVTFSGRRVMVSKRIAW
jgi:hypothetical protein